ncbi:hypothetical protein N7G274_004777 [Stereocaulon virgatum]|uniref:Uncharacterized protein n=1 Tax=Stereocaulon virgatum TaxID=373712 RepID=A0ABR4AC71_9LECA
MDLLVWVAARLRDKVDLQDLLSSVKESKGECQRKLWVVNNVVLCGMFQQDRSVDPGINRSVDPGIHRSGRYSYPIRSWTCYASVGRCTIRSHGMSSSIFGGICIGVTNL